ncbi:MAG: PKD domain-containing protein [candidate division Zixibacteria bacterium]|nr:PKD domain-containing protein [candidate division Zixibacteria bacterium]
MRKLKASLPIGAFFGIYVAFVFLLGDQNTAHSDDKPDTEHLFLECERSSDEPLSFSTGPPDARTGAPGESTCVDCHSSFDLNSGDGSLTLSAPAQFFPSDTIDIDVHLVDPGQQRWGFEITVLDSGNNAVGDLVVANSLRTQKSTDVITFRQYIKHTSLGTDNGSVDSGLGWTVRWVSPLANVGPVTFYAAGNAADGGGNSLFDYIYTQSTAMAIDTQGVRLSADTTFGKESLVVGFAGAALLTATSWTWDFGDGDSSMIQNPTHTYLNPGAYSVSVSIESSEGIFDLQVPDLIQIHADSLLALDTTAPGGGQATVHVYARNYIPVSRITIPFTWSGALPLTLVNVSNAGLRSDQMDLDALAVDPFGKRAVYRLSSTGGPLAPGSGPIISLVFNVGAANPNEATNVNISSHLGFSPLFVSTYADYTPTIENATVTEFCCDVAGDVDNGGDVNIGDAAYIVKYLFQNIAAPPCCEKADADGGGDVNIGDATFIVKYVFQGGDPPICTDPQIIVCP